MEMIEGFLTQDDFNKILTETTKVAMLCSFNSEKSALERLKALKIELKEKFDYDYNEQDN